MPLIRWIARRRQQQEMPELSPGAFVDHRSTENLRRILQRERTRAERSGEPVAAIVFTPRGRAVARSTERHLRRLLRRRLRCTDEVGSLVDGRLVAVLPGATSQGAWNVVDDVCGGFQNQPPPPHCDVYCYPSDPSNWLFEQEEIGNERREAQEPARTARAMELLLMRPIPVWKRAMDIFASAVALVLALPVFAVVAMAIKATSPGPVIFRQRRSGWGGRPFAMYKFRSMVADAEHRRHELMALNEQDGPAFKITNDPRTTSIGRFLRATKLDELPQLWNVLKGEMSLVGPRPLPCAESSECHGWHLRRLDVTPGLTCIWQIEGTPTIAFADWMRMDIRYIVERTPLGDVSLLFKTFVGMLIRR